MYQTLSNGGTCQEVFLASSHTTSTAQPVEEPSRHKQCPHQTAQHNFMMHYVKSGDKRRGGQLEHLAQKNAGTKSKHLRKLPLKQD